jgi:hypothetical protein
MAFNLSAASSLSTSPPENDRKLVRQEQGLVQRQLEAFQSADIAGYGMAIKEINTGLNDRQLLVKIFDPTFARAMAAATEQIGGRFNFAKPENYNLQQYYSSYRRVS